MFKERVWRERVKVKKICREDVKKRVERESINVKRGFGQQAGEHI